MSSRPEPRALHTGMPGMGRAGSTEPPPSGRFAAAAPAIPPRFLRSGLWFGSAIAAATVLNAVFQVSLARLSTPGEYSLLVTLFAAIFVLSVPALAVQTATAREVATRLARGDEAGAGAVVRSVARQVLVVFAIGCALAVLVGFATSPFLTLHHPWPLIWTAVTVAASFELAVVYGALQGMQRIGKLSLAQVGHVVAKLALGLTLAALGAGIAALMFALAVSAVATLCAAAVPLRSLLVTDAGHTERPRLFNRYSSGAAGTLGIFAILTTLDLLVARASFTPEVAGAYAAASVVARAILIVPSTVTTVLFPHVATLDDSERERRHLLAALAATGGLAFVVAALVAAFPHTILNLAFGHAYVQAAPWLWELTVAMTLYALAYIYLFHFLAVGRIGYLFVAGPIVLIQGTFYALVHARPLQLIVLQIGAAAALLVSSELFDRETPREPVEA
jgi:O-antigen/teichoic acid export membrane protein